MCAHSWHTVVCHYCNQSTYDNIEAIAQTYFAAIVSARLWKFFGNVTCELGENRSKFLFVFCSDMDSLERFMRAAPLPPSLPLSQGHRRALVHASLASAVGRKGRHMTGTFCLTGDTMEGIIQCLVFLKAFSVSWAWIDCIVYIASC